jgi:hypothetical protein
MKKSRLLEIIREEIAGALSEVSTALITTKKGETTPLPFNTPDEKISVMNLKKDSNITNIETTDGKNIKEEEQLNEEPFIDSAFDITGTSPENLNQDSLQNAIDDAVKVLQQENPGADVKELAGKLQKVNTEKNLGPNSKLSPELKGTLQKVADIIKKQGQIFGSLSKIDDLIKLAKDPSQINRLETLKKKGYTFILGNAQAITAIEKSLGLKPKNNDSLLADKSKEEKSAKEKSPKVKTEKAPKAKVATRTTGDDGFDTVTYSTSKKDSEEDKAAAAAAKVDKALGGKYAQELSSEDEAKYKEYKNDIDGLVKDLEDKFDKSKMAELRLYLEDSEVRKLFKAKGVKLSDLVRSVIK